MVIYGVIAFFTILILWRNTEGEDTPKNVAYMTVGIVTLLFSLAPYLTVEARSKAYSIVLFYDSADKALTFGKAHGYYQLTYISFLPNLGRADNLLHFESGGELLTNSGLDLVEYGLLSAETTAFKTPWDTNYQTFSGPLAAISRGTASGNTSSITIEASELKKIFGSNQCIVDPRVQWGNLICLPEGGRIVAHRSEGNRRIVFETNLLIVTFEITPSMAGVIQNSIPGVIDVDSREPNRFSTAQYGVVITGQNRRGRRFDPEAKKQWQWYEQLARNIQRFDWASLQDRTLDYRMKREFLQ